LKEKRGTRRERFRDKYSAARVMALIEEGQNFRRDAMVKRGGGEDGVGFLDDRGPGGKEGTSRRARGRKERKRDRRSARLLSDRGEKLAGQVEIEINARGERKGKAISLPRVSPTKSLNSKQWKKKRRGVTRCLFFAARNDKRKMAGLPSVSWKGNEKGLRLRSGKRVWAGSPTLPALSTRIFCSPGRAG